MVGVWCVGGGWGWVGGGGWGVVVGGGGERGVRGVRGLEDRRVWRVGCRRGDRRVKRVSGSVERLSMVLYGIQCYRCMLSVQFCAKNIVGVIYCGGLHVHYHGQTDASLDPPALRTYRGLGATRSSCNRYLQC